MPEFSTAALFLDRDGVVNHDEGYTHKIEEFVFLDGVFELCRSANRIGLKIFIVTNQSGIGRGYYTVEDFERLNTWMLQEFRNHGVDICDVFYCPDDPTEFAALGAESIMRKPAPGMILAAQRRYGVDLLRSVMIGDAATDMLAAHRAGVGTTVLFSHTGRFPEADADFRCASHQDTKNVLETVISGLR